MDSWIIDADAHVTEPPDVWASRVPSRYGDQIPRMVRNDAGQDVWMVDGAQMSTVGGTATAGWEDFPPNPPPRLADCHPGAYDANARLGYMDEVGIWAQVLYPNVAGFGNQQFLNMRDPEVKLLCVRAYNDFLHEWVSADARRLIPIVSLPFWNVKASVAEIERCAALGFRGILFTGEPQRFGLPTLGNSHWDPLWACAQDASLPIHFHVGSGDDTNDLPTRSPERLASTGRDWTVAYSAARLLLKNGIQCADLICSGVLVRFPKLKFVSVESGIGWIPTVLEQTDYMYHAYSGSDDRPSDLFRRQVYCTYWFEQAAPRLLGDIPVENVLFETDFPHPTSLYSSDIARAIETGLGHIDDGARRKILWDNAAGLYGIESPANPPGASGLSHETRASGKPTRKRDFS
jgi:predicted TIM-barrel fold metal-dependent hydrolase